MIFWQNHPPFPPSPVHSIVKNRSFHLSIHPSNHSYIQEHYQIMRIQAWPHFLQKKKKGDKGGNRNGLVAFDQSDFHGLGTCLVVRTLRGKSLMLHAFPFMDLSRLDGISFWQGPPTLYLWSEFMMFWQNHPPFPPSPVHQGCLHFKTSCRHRAERWWACC